MKILLDFQKSMRAVTLNSEFSLCGLIGDNQLYSCLVTTGAPAAVLGGGGGLGIVNVSARTARAKFLEPRTLSAKTTPIFAYLMMLGKSLLVVARSNKQ